MFRTLKQWRNKAKSRNGGRKEEIGTFGQNIYRWPSAKRLAFLMSNFNKIWEVIIKCYWGRSHYEMLSRVKKSKKCNLRTPDNIFLILGNGPRFTVFQPPSPSPVYFFHNSICSYVDGETYEKDYFSEINK